MFIKHDHSNNLRRIDAVIFWIFVSLLSSCGGGSSFSLTCSPPPQINSTPPTEAIVGERYIYVVDAIHECGFIPFVCSDFLVLQSPPETDVYSQYIAWTPSAAYANTSVTFRIATVPDYCGDSVQQVWTVFVQPPPPDTTPPQVTSVSPSVDALNVATTTQVRINFTEDIDPVSVTPASIVVSGPGGAIAGTLATSSNSVVFTPAADLPFTTTIGVTVTTAVRDLSGNGLTQDYSWSFTTGAEPDIAAPSVPTGLVATRVTGVEVALSWDSSTDNVAVAGYDVYRNGSFLRSVTGPFLSSDTGLDFNTEYCYTVSAYDTSANFSAQSAPLCVTTLDFVAGTVATWGKTTAENGTSFSNTIPDIEDRISNIKQAVLGSDQRTVVLLDGTVWQWGTTPQMVPGISNAAVAGAGYWHTLAITSEAKVVGWGDNNYGQLGDASNDDTAVPVEMVGINQALAVEGGLGHSLVLKDDGTVWATGGNWFGQLGDGTTIWKDTPVQVIGLTNIIAIAATSNYSLALKSDGSVWRWGGGSYTTYLSTPSQVAGLPTIKAISQGGGFSLAIAEDDTVWAWGLNGSGQLGDGTTTTRADPIQVSGLSNVIAIAAGDNHSLAITNDGNAWAWGANYEGQLGDGTLLNKLTPVQVLKISGANKIAAGATSSLATK